jgi:CBS-domain-containing membrane protein
MSSVGKVMKDIKAVQVSSNAGEALILLEEAGLACMPVVDKQQKLLGIAFKQALQRVQAATPLVKF